jgi:hypothetical protein
MEDLRMCEHKIDGKCEIDGTECSASEKQCENNPACETVPEIYGVIVGLAEAYR